MLKARPQYLDQLDFVQIKDFEDEGGDLGEAVKGVDGIVHVASVSCSPLCYHLFCELFFKCTLVRSAMRSINSTSLH